VFRARSEDDPDQIRIRVHGGLLCGLF
jgi:hypothetical protein